MAASTADSVYPQRCYNIPLERVVNMAKLCFGFAALALVVILTQLPRDGGTDGSLPRLLASTGTGHAQGDCEDLGVHNSLEGTLSFLIVCFLACCALEHWNLVIPDWLRLPISVVLFLAGMAVGVVFLRTRSALQGNGLDHFAEGMLGAAYLNSHAIFYVLLPPLLYESACSMSWRVFRKVLRSSVLLALPGVVLNTLFTACFVRAVFRVGADAVTWETSLLLASILSATDPVAVVAALHELGAPKKLATLIEGESLLNDGSAVVFFFVFLDMVATTAPDSTKQCEGVPPRIGCVVLYFLRLALGGPVLGATIGCILFAWSGKASAQHSPLLEIGIILAAVYGTFFLAESIHVSGVLAVVTLGVFVSASVQPRLSHDGRHDHHIVLAQISYHCNQVIFFAAGIISARFMWTDVGCNQLYKSGRAWGELASLYICIHLARAVVLLIFSPLLVRLGYGITWKEGTVLIYGGLRGAVGLAMGLIVENHQHVDRSVAAMVAFHVSGIVLLTLLINGTTVNRLYRQLDPYPTNAFRLTYLRNVFGMVEEECRNAIVDRMSGDWFFKTVDYQTILHCVPSFARIEFNPAGIPQPDGISTVRTCLDSLEDEGTKFNQDLVASMRTRQTPESVLLCKESNSNFFMDSLAKSAKLRPNAKDTMINIVSNGDRRLDFKAPVNSGLWGLYVSANPVSAVHAMEEQDHASFRVSVVAMKTAVPIVGLCNKMPWDLACEGLERQPIGSTPYSVGLACQSGIVHFHGKEGPGELQLSQSISEGQTLCITISKDPDGAWEVNFHLEVGGLKDASLGTVALGIPPDMLHPAIQFRPGAKPRTPVVKSGSGIFGMMSRSNTQSSQGTDAAELQPRPSSSAILRRMGSMSSWASSLAASRTTRVGARVSLSFELLSASMRESMVQLFHVFFNMVAHEYRNMHEEGLIGNEAYSWLSESLAAAVECTDGELNHVRAEDFTRYEVFKAQVSERTRKRTSEILRKTSDGPYLAVFEPAVVEYLTLEESVAADSWLDRCHRWTCTRRFGYGRTLTKVESLWAFIETHNKVIQECPAMTRYPDLMECLGTIVEMARRDLAFLEDVRCRRVSYCRHFLALRVLMTRKLEKLNHVIKDGWVSVEDCEELVAALRDRTHQLDNFVPSLRRRRKSAACLKRLNSASLDKIVPFDNGEPHFDPVDSLESEVYRTAVTRAELMALLRPHTKPAEPQDYEWRQTFRRLVGYAQPVKRNTRSSAGSFMSSELSQMSLPGAIATATNSDGVVADLRLSRRESAPISHLSSLEPMAECRDEPTDDDDDLEPPEPEPPDAAPVELKAA